MQINWKHKGAVSLLLAFPHSVWQQCFRVQGKEINPSIWLWYLRRSLKQFNNAVRLNHTSKKKKRKFKGGKRKCLYANVIPSQLLLFSEELLIHTDDVSRYIWCPIYAGASKSIWRFLTVLLIWLSTLVSYPWRTFHFFTLL